MARIAKAQRIDQRNWARAHGENIAQNAANTGRRALIRLDIGRMVMALHLEDGGLTIANINHARILARALNDMLILGREFRQMPARGFVGAMF